jgi:hypothetical protein
VGVFVGVQTRHSPDPALHDVLYTQTPGVLQTPGVAALPGTRTGPHAFAPTWQHCGGVGVFVDVGVIVGVSVMVAVLVTVAVLVVVAVKLAVGVWVGVALGVLVFVGVVLGVAVANSAPKLQPPAHASVWWKITLGQPALLHSCVQAAEPERSSTQKPAPQPLP